MASIKLSKFFNTAVFCGAWSFIIIYLWMAFHRMPFPFELEWIEGGMVDQVQRIVHGESVYIPPGIRFVPFLYPPLYFYLSAGASFILGPGLFPLRLVSFLASLVSFFTIFFIVHDETGDSRVAMISAGFFAATYRLAGAWLDIARVDSLFLALWLLFIYIIRDHKSLVRAALAGALVALVFLTKQLALVLCLPVIAYLFWRSWKYALTLLLVAIGLVGMTTLVFDRLSAGWYSFYIFGLLLGQTEWQPSQFVLFFGNDLLLHLPLAIFFCLSFFVFSFRQDTVLPTILKWLSVFAGALAGAFIARMKVGGYDNVLLPAYAAIAILFGLGLHRFSKMAGQLPLVNKYRVQVMLSIACLIQLAILGYNPYDQIPTASDLKAGYDLIHYISSVDGEVYLPDHGYLPSLAGKKTYAHHSTIWDVVRADQHNPASALLKQELKSAISRQVFSMIILDSEWNYCCQQIDGYYLRAGEVFPQEDVFYPVTGWARRPSIIFLPKRLQ